MANEVQFKVGTKIDDEEKKKLDPKEVAQLHATPPKMDVEPQLVYYARQVCPCCGCVGYGWETTQSYRYFTCHCCGCTFKA